MPSKKTIAEAYWQYTVKREDEAMERAKESLHDALLVNSGQKYSNDLRYTFNMEADRHIRRAYRLKRLAAQIVGRMMN